MNFSNDPDVAGAGTTAGKRLLPVISLSMSGTGLAVSILLAVLILLDFIDVPWDADFLPWLAFAGLIPISVVGLILSGICCCQVRDFVSIAAIVLGVCATVAAFATTFLIIVAAIASHPI